VMRDALAAGAGVYDLRGITDTVAADDPHAGLIRFKVGTGGEAVEFVGEGDLPLNRLLYKAFDVYMRPRGCPVPLTLHVDATRWRAHLAATVAANPGLIPVVKGNGYGFGLDLLLAEGGRRTGSSGVGMIAVGTYAEAPLALAGFPGDVLVMEPYRPVI